MRSLMIIVSTLALAACNLSTDAQGSGESGGRATVQNYNVGEFEGVSLAGSHDVIVTVGGPVTVRAEGDSKVVERLDIRVENGTLKVGTKSDRSWTIGFNKDRAPVTIYVTVPSLKAASVAGSGDLRIDKVEGDQFSASVAGSGDLQVGALKVNNADFSVAGSGDIRAAGTAATTKASIAGSGDIDITGLQSRDSNVSVVGSGDVRAHATQTAQVSIMGSGNVTMAGGARCTVNKRGSGEANCG